MTAAAIMTASNALTQPMSALNKGILASSTEGKRKAMKPASAAYDEK
tara:strand:+ start:1553 stop:1693 length:141 start_codon:yes stop_codon:yes gene_type:complete